MQLAFSVAQKKISLRQIKIFSTRSTTFFGNRYKFFWYAVQIYWCTRKSFGSAAQILLNGSFGKFWRTLVHNTDYLLY
jgi:hypothetical protein